MGGCWKEKIREDFKCKQAQQVQANFLCQAGSHFFLLITIQLNKTNTYFISIFCRGKSVRLEQEEQDGGLFF